MKTNLTLLSILLLSLSSCDLNEDPGSGNTPFYLRANMDGVTWAESPNNIGAEVDSNVWPYGIRIHGDLAGTSEYFYIFFPDITGTDITIVLTAFANRMEFHRNSQTWTSLSGNLTIHYGGSPTYREYSGIFSGTFFNSNDSTTISVTNGEYLAQGQF
jgi:hypothetical protein